MANAMHRLELIKRSWDKLTKTFGNLTHSNENENLLSNSNELVSCLQILYENDLEKTFVDWYFDEIREYLSQEIVIPFKRKSKDILLFHYNQLATESKQGKGNKARNKDKNGKITTLMNEETFNLQLWNDLLCKIEEIITEVSNEISSMKNVIWQLSTLLNAAYCLFVLNKKKKNYNKNNNSNNNNSNGNNKREKKQSIKTMQNREKMEKCLKNAQKQCEEINQTQLKSGQAAPSDMLQSLNNRLQCMIHNIFFSNESQEFNQLFSIMFEYSFIHFTKLDKKYRRQWHSPNKRSVNQISTNEYVSKFSNICLKLNQLHWLPVLEPIFREICFCYIEYEMLANYQAIKKDKQKLELLTESALLNKFEKWTNMVVLQWLHLIIVHKIPSINNSKSKNEKNENENKNMMSDDENEDKFDSNWMNHKSLLSWKMKIEYFVFEKFGQMRTQEMFEIIKIFPTSMPALLDLKNCLNRNNVTNNVTIKKNGNENGNHHSHHTNHNNNSNNRHHWRNLQLSLLKSFKQRLLIPHSSTNDIIKTYIQTIKALRILDASGITLEIVGDPIRSYLRGRDDAMKCVAHTLIENDTALLREYKASLLRTTEENDENDENNSQNGNNGNRNLNKSKKKKSNKLHNPSQEWKEWEQHQSHGNFLLAKYGFDNESESESSDNENGESWQPKTLDTDLINYNKSYFTRECDIVAMLVKIFGSRELFIQEYRNLLGKRLITMDGMRSRAAICDNDNGINIYEIEKEVENLELMKLRFGNDCMHNCEVMIKDVINSKRDFNNLQTKVKTQWYNDYLNNNNHNNNNHNNNNNNNIEWTKEQIDEMSSQFDAIIVSSKYWPDMQLFNLKKYSFEAPTKQLNLLFESYKQEYQSLKQNMHLEFMPFYGCVELELELNGNNVEMNVLPIQAAIITFMQETFDENKQLKLITLQDVCLKLKISQTQALENISFWERIGIVIHSSHELIHGYRLANCKMEEEIALQRLKQQKMDSLNGNNNNNGNGNECDTSMNGNDGFMFDNDNHSVINAANIEKQFESNVLGTLTQYNGKTLDQIFKLLKQLKLHPSFATLHMQQLQSVVDKLVMQGKIICRDGTYIKPQKLSHI